MLADLHIRQYSKLAQNTRNFSNLIVLFILNLVNDGISSINVELLFPFEQTIFFRVILEFVLLCVRSSSATVPHSS